MHDTAIVRSPFGPEVDGRRLLGEAVGFGQIHLPGRNWADEL